MAWWVYFIIGFVFLAGEIFMPMDFFMFFIGLAFLSVGTLSLTQIVEDPTILFLLAGGLSVAYVFIFKKYIKNLFIKKTNAIGGFEGEKVMVNENIEPGDTGSGSMRGSSWQVRNESNETLQEGSKYAVSSLDSLTIVIK